MNTIICTIILQSTIRTISVVLLILLLHPEQERIEGLLFPVLLCSRIEIIQKLSQKYRLSFCPQCFHDFQLRFCHIHLLLNKYYIYRIIRYRRKFNTFIRQNPVFLSPPLFPDIRLITCRSLFSISYNRGFQNLLVFKYFFVFVLICGIFYQRKQILVPTLFVKKIPTAAHCLRNVFFSLFTQTLVPYISFGFSVFLFHL